MRVINRRVRSLSHLACAKAEAALVRKSKHCAIVFDDRYKVMSIAVNEGFIHAEGKALEQIEKKHQSDNLSILVVRICKTTGEMKMSKPCACCTQTIRSAGIITVYYSASDGRLESYSVNK
jgi:tRNA(Arg) A34 adenosine deaminase TadA